MVTVGASPPPQDHMDVLPSLEVTRGPQAVELARREQPQGRGIEARHAQPGDRAVPTDEGGRSAVANETVVLDGEIPVNATKW